jgi:hypothetical protein
VAPQRSQGTDPVWPAVYQIRIEGHLGRAWTGWFEGMSIALEDNGDTLLTGAVVDQAALHGLLRKVRDLGVPLVSVNRLEPDPAPRQTDEGDGDVHGHKAEEGD